MANFSSLSDLKNILSDDEKNSLEKISSEKNSSQKLGYSGKTVTLKVALDSKRRKGKIVTLITGFESTPGELESLAQEMKRSCGAGGGVLDNAIEIQGDHIEKVKKFLSAKGYKVS